MKKILMFTCLCGIGIFARAEQVITLTEAQGIVETFYGSLQKMSQVPKGEVAIQSESLLLKSLGKDLHGNAIAQVFRVPNDVGHFSEFNTGDEPVSITNYIGYFLRVAENGGLKFSYKIISNEYQQPPEIDMKEKTPLFVRAIVQKEYRFTNRPSEQINDTMFINAETKSVSLLTNRYRKTRSWKTLSAEELMALAQNFYSEKRYDEAYTAYQRALEKDHGHEKAAYGLGVMTYKAQGCKTYPRKVRDQLSVFYFMKSKKGRESLSKYYGIDIPVRKGTYDIYRIAWGKYGQSLVGSGSMIPLFEEQYTEVLSPIGKCDYNPFPCNRLLIYDSKTEKFGYMNQKGDILIPAIYTNAYPFFIDGMTFVQKGKQWMLIDTTGKTLSSIGSVTPMLGGKYLVYYDALGYHLADRTSDHVTHFYLASGIRWFSHVDSPLIFGIKRDDTWGLFDASGKQLLPCQYKNIHVIKWEKDCIWVCVDYNEEQASKLKTIRYDDHSYNRNYNQVYNPETWKSIGNVMKVNL